VLVPPGIDPVEPDRDSCHLISIVATTITNSDWASGRVAGAQQCAPATRPASETFLAGHFSRNLATQLRPVERGLAGEMVMVADADGPWPPSRPSTHQNSPAIRYVPAGN
jgi:hypothetical protein